MALTELALAQWHSMFPLGGGRKRTLASALLLAVALSGCDTLSLKERQKMFMDENEVHVGKSYDSLIKEKGVPTGTAPLSDGSKVVEYYNAQVEVSGGESYSFPTTTYVRNPNGSLTWVYVEQFRSMPVRSWRKICKIDFIVSPQAIVSSWKYDGKGCY